MTEIDSLGFNAQRMLNVGILQDKLVFIMILKILLKM